LDPHRAPARARTEAPDSGSTSPRVSHTRCLGVAIRLVRIGLVMLFACELIMIIDRFLQQLSRASRRLSG
jgi:hypothetical protein